MEAKPTSVIVADDDSLMRNVLKAKLEALNQDVFLASDGVEAVALAAKIQASLVILDVRMPRLNGLQTCAEIRRLPGYATIPIVMLTADRTNSAQFAASRAGATTYLTKPFGSASLMPALSRFLETDDMTQRENHATRFRCDPCRCPPHIGPAELERSR
jgi:CheY-like chemotaxis protein